nr:hypothetical protein GCM10020093_027160 [Planobispora longispora]
MAVLYIGTFGSFIGYSTAFPLLIKSQFPEQASLITLAFLGPLVGSLIRPAGGWLADRIGGARVTLVNFGAMAAALLLVWQGLAQRSFTLFFAAYMLLIGTTGIGNGSTYRMIPAIFRAKATAGVAPARPPTRPLWRWASGTPPPRSGSSPRSAGSAASSSTEASAPPSRRPGSGHRAGRLRRLLRAVRAADLGLLPADRRPGAEPGRRPDLSAARARTRWVPA